MKTAITSPQNPRLKKVIQLRERSARRSSGLTVVEGAREVLRAVESSRAGLEEIFVCRDIFKNYGSEKFIQGLEFDGVAVFEVDRKIFSKISFGDRMEGLLAVCRARNLELKDLELKKNPLLVVVEGLEKPGNLGAILRTCDGAGVDAVLVCDAKTDIYNPHVIRASLGTVFCVAVVQAAAEAAFKFLQDREIQLCATTPQTKVFYFEANFKLPTAIVVGSEEKGLSDFWLEHADQKIKIPMKGKADSLNVSATAGIVVYEALRQRNEKKVS